MKLTTAQRTAMTTIQAGGVTRYTPRYGLRAAVIAVPVGARRIVSAMYDRLHEADLAETRVSLPANKQPIGGTRYDVILTPRGVDALAGKTRRPVVLSTRIAARAAESARGDAFSVIVTTEVDPYLWDRWSESPDELARRVERVNATAIKDYVTAETIVREVCT